MDLTFSPEEEAFRKDVRTFIAENLPPDVKGKARRDMTSKDDFLKWHQILYKKGWVAPLWPKEYGGTGWNVTQRYIFNEEVANAEMPTTLPFGLNMVAPVIFTYGNDDDSKRWPNSLTHHIVGGHYGYPYDFLAAPDRALVIRGGASVAKAPRRSAPA